MCILVTGGAGFIGANLCQRLLEQNHEVIAVDNLITSDGGNLNKLRSFPNFTFIKHDITNPLPHALTAYRLPLTAIYHLACPTGVPNLTKLAEEMLLTCSIGTRNILELARTHKAKFLVVSSSETYGNPLIFPQTENYTGNVDPTGIRSPYEEGKRFTESLVSIYVRKYKLDAKIVRVFNTYGPGMDRSETRVVPRFLRQALSNKPITIHGKGTQTRTFCYVDDLVNGLLIIMKKGKSGEVYNLGSDQQVTIRQLAELIINVTKSKSKIIKIKRLKHDHESRLPDLTKVKKLGWKLHTPLEDGLRKTSKSLNPSSFYIPNHVDQ
ncbi:TPA: hypothetical protein DIV55_00625 [Patescibacteria group bacterium]|uniref:3-beta hydroxysteroid dehydrogenase/isomerase family protein n=1 Tax=Candidatus Gottesmanbacteria bacterium GW2011_GWA1_43_11 TaxID=1618436 RepID=A0A0G1FFZ0_9BACT|nr:MAG: 3-beta hydroxysteroid dehydrogenase/isomerase family protein [Candidatus Gottesmanbacteria bacterium GW2011_GWA1_43_11]HCS78228.1 hypothetical protein [Patescibacteria group bacterium]